MAAANCFATHVTFASSVMVGLDPTIQTQAVGMDPRVKPEDDDGGYATPKITPITTVIGAVCFNTLIEQPMRTKMMNRTAINPWNWSLKLGYNQAEMIEGAKRQLNCAGQTSVDADGNPQFVGDMRGQIGMALDNLEAVLAKAEMGLDDITRLVIYATDVDEALKNFDLLGMRFGPAQASPPMTLVGVPRLAIPSLMFEIEATAAA